MFVCYIQICADNCSYTFQKVLYFQALHSNPCWQLQLYISKIATFLGVTFKSVLTIAAIFQLPPAAPAQRGWAVTAQSSCPSINFSLTPANLTSLTARWGLNPSSVLTHRIEIHLLPLQLVYLVQSHLVPVLCHVARHAPKCHRQPDTLDRLTNWSTSVVKWSPHWQKPPVFAISRLQNTQSLTFTRKPDGEKIKI